MLRAGSDCATGGAAVALTRLYVVCCKGLTEDTLACMFRAYPGLEYCDLKRDHLTGQSRVRARAPGSLHAPAFLCDLYLAVHCSRAHLTPESSRPCELSLAGTKII